MTTSYKVSEAAAVLGVSSPTVRRWSKDFSPHLSTLATPDPGVERLFTDDDLKVLGFIRDRFAGGLTTEAILAELPTATLPDLASLLSEGRDRVVTPGDSPDLALDSPMTAQEAFKGIFDRLADSGDKTAQTLDRIAERVDLAVEVATLKGEVAELRRLVEVLTNEVADLRRRRGIFF